MNLQDGSKEWGGWLRAPPRRAAGQERSKWLRDERDADWGTNLVKDNYYHQTPGMQVGEKVGEGSQGQNFRIDISETAIISELNNRN